ncbi:MAG TPA: uracil-DNA glycosylase [Thermofilum sp.]|nr:uracil-DNA glycosylase [Thermofilum sp.]
MNNCEKVREKIKEIANEIISCTKCPLYASRRNAVPGEGDPCSGVMMIGEAPGVYEDEQGKPFVGAAGKLLTTLLQSIGLSRDEIYITNLVKCRPPGNRDPKDSEIKACSPYLKKQVAVIRPYLIVTLGRHSTRYFFNISGRSFNSIMKVRGKFYSLSFNDVTFTLLPTLHPAAALYNPSLRRILEEDFKRIKDVITKEKDRIGLERYL